ncbi:WD repeat-containing protein 82, partial [Cladochytrium tenue]
MVDHVAAPVALAAAPPTPTAAVVTRGDVLTDARLESFRLAKVFKDNERHITSMDYDASGEFLLTVSDDDSLRMYDCISGAVTALEMSPQEDLFLSASADGTVRLWDLRSPACLGVIRTRCERSCISFDPTGLVFTVASKSSELRLYDAKNYAAGPFSTYILNAPPSGGGPPAAPSAGSGGDWISLRTNNDGKYLLVSTAGDAHLVVDSFSGNVVQRLRGIANNAQVEMEASFTPDGKYVVS